MLIIKEILPSLAKAKVFSVLDIKDGFWQVKLESKSHYLTTFWNPFRHYWWLHMPFRIAPASEECQCRQHEAVEGQPRVGVIADHIRVNGWGDTTEEATKYCIKDQIGLLQRTWKLKLHFNRKKLRLRISSVHGTFPERRRSASWSKVRAITWIPKPDNVLPFRDG